MTRRLFALALLAALLVVGVMFTDEPHTADRVVFGVDHAPIQPIVPPGHSLGVSWFCPGVPATAEEPGAILVSNPTDSEVKAVVDLVRSDGTAVQTTEAIAARTTLVLALDTRAPAPFTAAMIESRSASLLVEQRAVTKVGVASSPCVVATSKQWHSADGSTSRDARYDLVMFNPYPADAVVDLEFFTEEGPGTETGIYVPAGTLKVVDLGERGTRRKNEVALTVTAIAGRVVAGRVLRFDGTGSRFGIVAGPLAPAPATSWVFADGIKAERVVETIVVYNPGKNRAEIEVEIFPDDLTTVPLPLTVSVPPGSFERVEMFRNDLLAVGSHRVVITSLNDVPVVVERVIDDSSGFSSTFGSFLSASRWWFVDGNTTTGRRMRIVVANPTGLEATVTVRVLGVGGLRVVPGAENLLVAGGRSVTLQMDELLAGQEVLTILVDATGPVIAERLQRADVVTGAHRVLGLPEAGTPALSAPIGLGDLPDDLVGDGLDSGPVDSGPAPLASSGADVTPTTAASLVTTTSSGV